ncbi:MAG: hypothetical protein VR75_17130 [Hyphomonadaceae bacterium BRH_c29]|nr:MAG: hypothetical protein VR75_17130 [Hyphomonadaceae bacterium BRH_c29]
MGHTVQSFFQGVGQGQTSSGGQAFLRGRLHGLDERGAIGVWRGGAGLQHIGIASGFLIRPEGAVGKIGQWIEPHAGEEEFGCLQGPKVAAANMGQLVRDGGALLSVVIIGFEPGRQQDDRADKPRDQRAGRNEAGGNHRQVLQADLLTDLLGRALQTRRNRHGFALHRSHEVMLAPEAEAEEEKGPACPEHK